MTKISKVLVIGSGPMIIGQAAEFDCSGTHAAPGPQETVYLFQKLVDILRVAYRAFVGGQHAIHFL